jgi:hypothetical protein
MGVGYASNQVSCCGGDEVTRNEVQIAETRVQIPAALRPFA